MTLVFRIFHSYVDVGNQILVQSGRADIPQAIVTTWTSKDTCTVIVCWSGALACAKRVQRGTVGEKIWLSRHPINFFLGQNRTCVRPPLYVSWGERRNSNKAESFFRLNFNAYTNVDNRERAWARDNKQNRTNFAGRKTWKFYSGSE